MKYNIKNLTIDEKIDLLTSNGHWRTKDCNGKLKQIFVSDGPLGLRMQDTEKKVTGTVMPATVNLANSWDKESSYLCGKTIADECIENDVDILLAPGVNIKRSPLNGRNFEYYSEDPYLAGTLACEYIKGVQDKGIGTSLKHFAVNNNEQDRFNISSEVDNRTFHEIYLKVFELALKAQPWTVMCSYNPVNGILASENRWLLKDVLRDELGYKGAIISDWQASRNHIRGLKATLDIVFPEDKSVEILKEAYVNGEITEEEIDFCVQNILELIEKTENAKKKVEYTKEQRHANSVKIGRESVVLLKNEDNILPFTKGKVCVVGGTARIMDSLGTGSAKVISDYQFKKVTEWANLYKTGATYFDADYCTRTENQISNGKNEFEAGYDADYVLYVVKGIQEGEGYNKHSMRLPVNQEMGILEMAEYNPNIVVVLFAGSPVDMSPWIDKVKGVIFIGYAGEGYHEVLAEIITGKTCPSGKLSETFPIWLEDTYCGDFVSNSFYDEYSEGIFVGYRYYDKYKIDVAYPFGYGLSYANFEYSNLKVKKITETDYEISYDIKNTSKIDAKEISQVYVKDVFATVSRPIKELKAYSKDLIKAGETKTITHKLDESAFAFYSDCLKKWYVENGKFEIMVGSSSKDIKLIEKIDIKLPESTQYTDCHNKYYKLIAEVMPDKKNRATNFN